MESLLKAGARVSVVSPRLTEKLQALLHQKKIQHVSRSYRPGDLTGFEIAFVATDDRCMNKTVAEEGRRSGVWVNAVDDPRNCDFIVPSVIQRGPLTVAVGSGGGSPAVSKLVREELEEKIGHEYSELARIAAEVRRELKDEQWLPSAATWGKALRGDVRRLIRQGQFTEAKSRLKNDLMGGMLAVNGSDKNKPVGAVGTVYLVGAGPGAADLLTVRARDLLSNADVVVYDRLVNRELLEHCHGNVKLVYVGKKSGHHLIPSLKRR